MRPAALAAVVAILAAACRDELAPVPVSPSAAPGDPVAPGPAAPGTWFRQEFHPRGLLFEHSAGRRDEFLLPESVCAGCALLDMDGDGDLDAYLLQSDGVRTPRAERRGNRLFRNRGDGTFEDATEGSGAATHLFAMGVACGDADGDGDTDLFVTGLDGLALLLNDGAGRFTDATAASGIVHADWASSAAFLDYDGDGDLDLFAACYVRWTPEAERVCEAPYGGRDYCSPKAYGAPAPDRLWRNDGGGRFTDVSEAAGLRTAFGNGLGVAVADFDGDGRPDVFVANDASENQLWMQTAPGRFRDEALVRGCAMDRGGTAKAGMGVVAIDADDDGDIDLHVVNLVDEGDSFFRNDGGRFTDRTTASGLVEASRPFTRFGLCVADLDLDGVLDAYVACGRVVRLTKPWASDRYAEPNQVLRGIGGGRFEAVEPHGGTETPVFATSRGAALGDIDGDGDLDVLVANRDAPAHLFVNVAPRRGNWAMLRVVERTGADAIGATVTARAGARSLRRDVVASAGYCSSGDPRIHVGLGPETKLGGVRVRWTDGTDEEFGDLDAGKVHALRRGGGRR